MGCNGCMSCMYVVYVRRVPEPWKRAMSELKEIQIVSHEHVTCRATGTMLISGGDSQ